MNTEKTMILLIALHFFGKPFPGSSNLSEITLQPGGNYYTEPHQGAENYSEGPKDATTSTFDFSH